MPSQFQQALTEVLAYPSFKGSQKALAKAACIDAAQLNRFINGGIHPTPEIVGRMAGALPRGAATVILQGYLADVAARIAAVTKPDWHTGSWRSPASFPVQISVG